MPPKKHGKTVTFEISTGNGKWRKVTCIEDLEAHLIKSHPHRFSKSTKKLADKALKRKN